MFKLPPVKLEAIIILGTLWILFIILSMLTSAPGGPKPNTVASGVFLLVALLLAVVACWGSLFSATIRNSIFEPSAELEESALGLLVGGGIAALLMANVLQRIWVLRQ